MGSGPSWVRTALLGLVLAAALGAGQASAAEKGYLTAADRTGVMAWLPPRPADGSPADRADYANFWATRALVASARGQQAPADDVNAPSVVAPRMPAAAGVEISDKP